MCSADRRYFFFCLTVAQCSRLKGTICSVALFVSPLHIKQQCCRLIVSSNFLRFHLPYRPVRSGPHLLQIPVPLRYFPWCFVNFQAVIARPDSRIHLIYYKLDRQYSTSPFLNLFRLFRRYDLIVPDPTYALTRDHCAAVLRAHPEVAKSHSRVLL